MHRWRRLVLGAALLAAAAAAGIALNLALLGATDERTGPVSTLNVRVPGARVTQPAVESRPATEPVATEPAATETGSDDDKRPAGGGRDGDRGDD